jgi:hypothetical protein
MTNYLSRRQALTLDIEKNNASRKIKKWMNKDKNNRNNAFLIHEGVNGSINWLNLLSRRLIDKAFDNGHDDLIQDMINIITLLARQFKIFLDITPEQTIVSMNRYFDNINNAKLFSKSYTNLEICKQLYHALIMPDLNDPTKALKNIREKCKIAQKYYKDFKKTAKTPAEQIKVQELKDEYKKFKFKAKEEEVKNEELDKDICEIGILYADYQDYDEDIDKTVEFDKTCILDENFNIYETFQVVRNYILEFMETSQKYTKFKIEIDEFKKNAFEGCECKKENKKLICNCQDVDENGLGCDNSMNGKFVDIKPIEYVNIAGFPSMMEICKRMPEVP